MGLIFTEELHPLPKKLEVKMKLHSNLKEVKELLVKPWHIVIGLLVIVLSALCIYFTGYIQWRRIFLPFEILVSSFLGFKIAAQIHQAHASRVIRTFANGIVCCALLILIGGILDTLLFADHGYLMFAGIVGMWLWIPFQLHRLYIRLLEMPEEGKKLVTDSTDVIYAQMAHREKELKYALDQYHITKHKLGLTAHIH